VLDVSCTEQSSLVARVLLRGGGELAVVRCHLRKETKQISYYCTGAKIKRSTGHITLLLPFFFDLGFFLLEEEAGTSSLALLRMERASERRLCSPMWR